MRGGERHLLLLEMPIATELVVWVPRGGELWPPPSTPHLSSTQLPVIHLQAEPPTCPSRSEAGVYISSFGVEGDEIGVEGDDIYLPPPPSDSLKCFFF